MERERERERERGGRGREEELTGWHSEVAGESPEALHFKLVLQQPQLVLLHRAACHRRVARRLMGTERDTQRVSATGQESLVRMGVCWMMWRLLCDLCKRKYWFEIIFY